jgi:hypothetical protein
LRDTVRDRIPSWRSPGRADETNMRLWYGHAGVARGVLRSVVRVVLTVDGIDAAADQGVDLATIRKVLAARQILVEDIDPQTRAVSGRVGGRLVTVWLIEGGNDVWELALAFEAGFATELTWTHGRFR